jgi:hypothetical protein
MGGFDCFCAFCGGSIVFCRIGSGSETSQRLRRVFVQRKRQEIQTGEYAGSEEEFDEDVDEDDYEDSQNTYDPKLVSDESLAWVTTIHALGCNPDALGNSRNKGFVLCPICVFLLL